LLATPLLGPGDRIIAVASDGEVSAVDPVSGARAWTLHLPVEGGQDALVLATPIRVDDLLIVAYQRVVAGRRVAHTVSVVDLALGRIHPDFPTVTLAASSPVPFNPPTQASRAALAVIDRRVYVSLGNIQDIQPFHGWVFELDLDAWRAGGSAISASLVATLETDCGTPGTSGARERQCGGGIWAPAGPQVIAGELFVPTGNGQLDVPRGDYANALLRVGPGLIFDPECDASCDVFDVDEPATACLDSCRNLFVPRLMSGESPLRPESGACEGMTLLQCYAALDWDLGANAPAEMRQGDKRLLLLPGKDGALYLIDADHLGTLYDRLVIAAPCGTRDDRCLADWAGMMVTQPAVDEATQLALVPTFEFDRTHPAGVVAVGIEPGPRLSVRWRSPPGEEAERQFRRHPGRISFVTAAGQTFAFVLDVGGDGGKGLLYGMRPATGEIVFRARLDGPGQRYVRPLVLGDRLYLTSCDDDDGPSYLQGYRVLP
jgi:hypothetical protein